MINTLHLTRESPRNLSYLPRAYSPFTSPVLLVTLKVTKRLPTLPVLNYQVRTVRNDCIYHSARGLLVERVHSRFTSPSFKLSGTRNCGRHIKDASPETYSISKRPFQMGGVISDMAVNFGKHTSVSMSHDGSNGKMIVSLNEFAGSEPMTRSVHKHALADTPGKQLHSVTNGKLAPSSPSGIAEYLTFWVFLNKSADNLQSTAVKIDNALCSLPLALFGREYNALVFWLKMAFLYVSALLRPTAGKPTEGEKFMEGIAFRNKGNDLLEVLRPHINLTAFSHWLWNLTDRTIFKVAHLHTPVINPLDSDNSPALVVVSPSFLRINPFRQIVRLQRICRNLSYAGICKKIVEIIGVPFARTRRTVFAVPSRELGNQRVYCNNVLHLVGYMEELLLNIVGCHFLVDSLLTQATDE